jgi:ATP-dependent DNA ligase
MSVLSILNSLAAVSSRNEKLAILRTNKDNLLLKEFFRLALDPLITFGIKKIPVYTPNRNPLGDDSAQLDWGMDQFEKQFATRAITGNDAISHLTYVLENVTEDNAEVLIRILGKDPKCGVAEATVNSVWKGLIFDFPVMKATPHDEKTIQNISFPAYSQLKLDGARAQIVINNGTVTVYSSSGRPIETHGYFDWFANVTDNLVFDGELLVTEDTGKFMERKKGNGIVNRAVKGTIPAAQAKQLHFVAFDIVPLADWKAGIWRKVYEYRFQALVQYSEKFRHNASVVETKMVNSEREALNHFKKLYKDGNEGTILKDKESFWENKRSKYQLKMKGILTCDLRVVGVEEGTGKNKGKIGALVCQSSDSELEVNVGTGLTDQDRAEKFSFFIDKIVEVQYNERIVNKTDGAKWSLFLPRFVQVRIDKNEADSLNLISIKGV